MNLIQCMRGMLIYDSYMSLIQNVCSRELSAGGCDGWKGPWRVHKQARGARSARGVPGRSDDAQGREEGEMRRLKRPPVLLRLESLEGFGP